MKQAKSLIRFHVEHPFKFRERKKLKKWINLVFEKEGKALSTMNYIFCSDAYLLKINQDFLQHDTLTDIITFDMSENLRSISGEIYVSVERVIENAIQFNIPFDSELQRVMVHGVLHLCGYKDKSPSEQKLMRLKENFYLGLLQ